MARTEPRPCVAVEVLVKEDMVPPVRILLEFVGAAVHRTAPVAIPKENPREPVCELRGDVKQVHQPTGAGGTLDFEVVSVIEVEVQQRPDDEGVHRHPDRSTPVRVPTEHAAVGLPWQIIHPVFLSLRTKDIGLLLVELGERTNTEGTEELLLVEHLGENPAEPFL